MINRTLGMEFLAEAKNSFLAEAKNPTLRASLIMA